MTQLAASITGAIVMGVPLAVRWAVTRRRTAPAPAVPTGVVTTGVHYCPDCLRLASAVLHVADGSATCTDCWTHTTATGEVRCG